MILKFINRKEELGFLEERYGNKNFEFFVIYGRRRVGKTELIKTFLGNKPHIYFLCDKSGTSRNIYRFKRKIAEYFNEPLLASGDLEEIFSYLIEKIKRGEGIIIVFDEFSYLIEKDPAMASVFQVVCDEILKNKNVFLILCGSSVSMMEKGVLSYKSPLYGRKTAHIKLNPVVFDYFSRFFPSNSLQKNMEFYSILGGVPFYLEKFSDKKTSLENIKEQIFSKKGKLYEEIDFLLREELREPDVYKTILSAIASGERKVVDIANKSGIGVQDIDKYLKVLMRLGVVKKETLITKIKSKKSIYLIDDNFFDFCFVFFEPYKSDLEIGELKNAENKFKAGFLSYVGKKFEKLVQDEILRKMGVMEMEKVGRWWGHYRDRENKRKEIEIDVVGLNEKKKEILFGECKWKEKVDAEGVVRKLKEKAEYVEWFNNKRKESYVVFAKSFSKKLKEFEGRKVWCYDLGDIKKLLGK